MYQISFKHLSYDIPSNGDFRFVVIVIICHCHSLGIFPSQGFCWKGFSFFSLQKIFLWASDGGVWHWMAVFGIGCLGIGCLGIGCLGIGWRCLALDGCVFVVGVHFVVAAVAVLIAVYDFKQQTII